MRVTDAQLADVLARDGSASRFTHHDPAATFLVESMAATYPEHGAQVREVGQFLCGLVSSGEADGLELNPSLAMHTLLREEHTPPERMWSHLAATAQRDLLLGLSAQALLRGAGTQRHGKRSPAENHAVLHTLYVLVRAFEGQEETNALEWAVRAECAEGSETLAPPEELR